MDAIRQDLRAYEQSYQKAMSIPEVRSLVAEVIRLMSEQYYSVLELGSEYIAFYTKGMQPGAVPMKLHYSKFNLNNFNRGNLGFVKYLCKEIYSKLGYDLKVQMDVSLHGARSVLEERYHASDRDRDSGSVQKHNASLSTRCSFLGRELFDRIAQYRQSHCSVDEFPYDPAIGDKNYTSYHHVAYVPAGFFHDSMVFELSKVTNMYATGGTWGITLINSTSNPNPGPKKIDW